MTDYVDSCVFLAAVLGEHEEEVCHSYLTTLGYKHHAAGVVSHLVVSEVHVALLRKTRDPRARSEETLLRLTASVTKIFSRLLEDERLQIAKPSIPDEEFCREVQTREFRVTTDDALHLAAAVATGCARFVTLDKTLLTAEQLKGWLRREYGLKITNP